MARAMAMKRRILLSLRPMAVILLLQVLSRSRNIIAFVPSLPSTATSPSPSILTRSKIQPANKNNRPLDLTVSIPTARRATAESAAPTTAFDTTATKLLELVLEQRNQDIKPRVSVNKDVQSQEERSKAIEALIERLTLPVIAATSTQANTKFFDRLRPPSTPCYYYDPSESLFGSGFYCTLYFYYPNTSTAAGGNGNGNNSKPPEDPIWEKTSLKPSNIKGQQYYVRNDFQQSVINYSEVWGSDVTIKAEGVLTPIDDDDDDDEHDKAKTTNVSTNNAKEDSRTLRRLPDVFRVDATKISASFFGLTLDFSIQGSANLVVLYADPRIRIFVSPLPSETVVGNWEQAGLVVVQVRGDLVPASNENMPRLVDLR